jgi:hypothetical protein
LIALFRFAIVPISTQIHTPYGSLSSYVMSHSEIRSAFRGNSGVHRWELFSLWPVWSGTPLYLSDATNLVDTMDAHCNMEQGYRRAHRVEDNTSPSSVRHPPPCPQPDMVVGVRECVCIVCVCVCVCVCMANVIVIASYTPRWPRRAPMHSLQWSSQVR